MPATSTGLEQLISDPPPWVSEKRLGLLCNPASIDRGFRHAKDLINSRFPGRLNAIFSPQHGFYAEKQDNMVESEDSRDPETGLPVYSLYGRTLQPTAAMFDRIDVLVVDLQDVGTRVYTFAATLSYCLEKAAELDKRVLVLDRPNPLGGIAVEGNCLAPEFASFVGRHPIPMRHGLTLGELATYMNEIHSIHCRLSVIPMKGWRREMFFPDTGLPWVPPSPNLPTPHAAMVYPGQVLLEGTNISEGRGTTTPFEVFGAPFLDPQHILSSLGGAELPGAVLRPVAFEPMFHKWRFCTCRGLHIHVTRPDAYQSYETSLKLLQAILYQYPEAFQWRKPPYEYEWEKLPIDLIAGTDRIRAQLERLEPVEAMAGRWRRELEKYMRTAEAFHLYG
jgi:uncharacterized protein YbbC (DUF1343 family)